MLRLKAGDKVWVFVFQESKMPSFYQKQISGFTPGLGLIHYADGTGHHFSAYSFYGSGYHRNHYVIVTRHFWEIPFAWLKEKIRLGE